MRARFLFYKLFFSISLLSFFQQAKALSPDFISKYVENSKVLYADNGYEVVQEKIFNLSDLYNGNNKIAWDLEPGEYFVQLISEPCLKVNVEVKVPSVEEKQGIVSEKPGLHSAIAIFDVPSAAQQFTEFQLHAPAPAFCSNAKARLLIYKNVAEN